MSEQKPEKLTANTTPEKPRSQQPKVRLTEEQLEAIAGGLCSDDDGDTTNHNQSLVSLKEGMMSPPPPEKPRPQPPKVQLTQEQLEAIAAGIIAMN